MAEPRTPLGSRGYYATVKSSGIDLRLHQRDFVDYEKLHPTWRGITLNKEEWYDLVSASSTITACLEDYQNTRKEPSLFVPLGNQGVHAVVNVYKDMLLVQVRVFTRSFYDPDKLFPTKKGVALKVEEWITLRDNMEKLSGELSGEQ